MNTIVIACAAALFATALAVTVFALGRRSRRATDAKLLEVASELDERMASMVRDLSGALERAQAENRRTRLLGELGGSIDLDEVVARTLTAAGELDGVDASVLSIPVEGSEPLVAAAGLDGAVPTATICTHWCARAGAAHWSCAPPPTADAPGSPAARPPRST